KDLSTVIAQAAATAVKEMGLEGRFAELERERLARLAGEWLDLEKQRAPIDYKTGGMMTPRQWEGPRPDDPQLPLYAVAAPEELAAVTFAKLRPGDMKFLGYSRAEHLLPNVTLYRDWPKLLEQWKKDAEALGQAFAAGDAHVDPKEELKTCRRCDLQTLCRVYEKFSGSGTEPD